LARNESSKIHAKEGRGNRNPRERGERGTLEAFGA